MLPDNYQKACQKGFPETIQRNYQFLWALEDASVNGLLLSIITGDQGAASRYLPRAMQRAPPATWRHKYESPPRSVWQRLGAGSLEVPNINNDEIADARDQLHSHGLMAKWIFQGVSLTLESPSCDFPR